MVYSMIFDACAEMYGYVVLAVYLGSKPTLAVDLVNQFRW